MLSFLGLLVVLSGLAAFVVGLIEKKRANRLLDAPLLRTGDVKAWLSGPPLPGPVAVEGNVVCDEPLISPVTGRLCLYYRVRCTALGTLSDTRPAIQIDGRVVADHEAAAPFGIDDGSGVAWIDAGQGGDFTPLCTVRRTAQTSPSPFGGSDVMFGNYRVHTTLAGPDARFVIDEEILPFVPKLHANGEPREGRIGSGKLILANRARADLLASSMYRANSSLAIAFAAVVAGSALGVVGSIHRARAAAVPAAPAIAAITTPAAAPAAVDALPDAPPVAAPDDAPPPPKSPVRPKKKARKRSRSASR